MSITLLILSSLSVRGSWHKAGDGLCCSQLTMIPFDHYEKTQTSFDDCKVLCENTQGIGGICLSISHDFKADICYLNVNDGVQLLNLMSPLVGHYNSVHPAAACGGGHTYVCYARDIETETVTLLSKSSSESISSSTSLSTTLSLSDSNSDVQIKDQTLTVSSVQLTTTKETINPTTTISINKSANITTPTTALLTMTVIDLVEYEEESPTKSFFIIPKKETIPLPLMDAQADISKATAAVAILAGIAAGSVSGTPHLGKMSVLMQLNCDIEGLTEDDGAPLPWELHPLGLSIGSGRERYLIGSIICNFGLLMAFTSLFWIVAGIKHSIHHLTRTSKTFNKSPVSATLAHLRYPGMVYVPAMFLLQGISFSSAKIMFHPSDRPAHTIIIALVSFLISITVPLFVWLRLLRARNFYAARYSDPKGVGKKLSNKCWRFMFGTHMWVSTKQFFVEKFGVIFEPMGDGMQWWSVFEAYHVVLVGALAAYEAKDKLICHIRNFTLSLSLLIYFILAVRYSPFSGIPDNILCKGVSLALFLAVIILTFGILRPTEEAGELFAAAGWIFIIATFFLLIKMVYDLLLYGATFNITYRSGVGRDSTDSVESVGEDVELRSCESIICELPSEEVVEPSSPPTSMSAPLRLVSPGLGQKLSNDVLRGSFNYSFQTTPEYKKPQTSLSSPKILPPCRRLSVPVCSNRIPEPILSYCPSDPNVSTLARNTSFLYSNPAINPVFGIVGPPAIAQSEALQSRLPAAVPVECVNDL